MKIFACCPICGGSEFVGRGNENDEDCDWTYYCVNCDEQIDEEEMVLKEESDL